MGRNFVDLTDRHLRIKIQDENGEVDTEVGMIRDVPSELAEKYVEELERLAQLFKEESFQEV